MKAFEHLPLQKKAYYYNQNAIANLLSLGQIAKEFTLKMNTAIDDAIYVYDREGKYIRFARTKANLYIMRTCTLMTAKTNVISPQ